MFVISIGFKLFTNPIKNYLVYLTKQFYRLFQLNILTYMCFNYQWIYLNLNLLYDMHSSTRTIYEILTKKKKKKTQ